MGLEHVTESLTSIVQVPKYFIRTRPCLAKAQVMLQKANLVRQQLHLDQIPTANLGLVYRPQVGLQSE